MCTADIFLALIAILFPPIAVWIKCGLCSADSVINILLCMLGYVPGLLHSWYIIAKYPDENAGYETIPSSSSRYPHQQQQQQRRRSAGGRRHYDDDDDDDVERGNATVTYYYVQRQPPPQPQPQQHQQAQGYQRDQTPMPMPSQAAHTMNAGRYSGDVGVDVDAAEGGGSNGGAVPPSYAEAVKGDNKVQR